jgi:hypothetical protein
VGGGLREETRERSLLEVGGGRLGGEGSKVGEGSSQLPRVSLKVKTEAVLSAPMKAGTLGRKFEKKLIPGEGEGDRSEIG